MKQTTLAIFLLFFASLLWGHGVDFSVGQRYPAVFVQVEYAGGGGSLAHGDVAVLFNNDVEAYQRGRTDKNGTFSFCPDKPGQWTVTVDDGTGHRGKTVITIGADFFQPAPTAVTATEPDETQQTADTGEKKTAPPSLCCYLLKILLGVGLILLITVILRRLKTPNET